MAPRRPPPEKQHLARLCDLVAAALLPHLEAETSPTRQLTREDERRLLLALSRANKAIRGWDEEERVCASDQETVSCSGEVHSCCLPPEQPYDGFGCLVNMVSILVGFLGFCSDYVKHSAGNILVSISSTLIKFESIWIQFIELVWVAIDAAVKCVHNALPSTTNSHDVTISSTNITIFMEVLNLRCLSISGQMMASLFRVLHAILKFLKHIDSELKDDFICLSIHHIQKMPWDSFHQIDAGELDSRAKSSRVSFCNDSAQAGILTGSLLQLLCSLLEQSYLEDTDGQDMYVKLVDIVPRIVAFLQEQHDGPKSLYQYSKHKILVTSEIQSSTASLVTSYYGFMNFFFTNGNDAAEALHPARLFTYGLLAEITSTVLSRWLKLLQQYFQDLHEPILQLIAKPDNSLEGSPFLSSMEGLVEIEDKSTWHFQRQAIYLFLSFSMCLSYDSNDGRLQCLCKTDECLLGHKVQGCTDHCNCFGLSKISDWFQRCYLDMSFDSKSSTDFALSFLQLYMKEDDMLFSILLQLLDAPLIFLKTNNKKTTELTGAKLFSSIFNPIHLFHLLLLLLHYDHLVLVDYLISKDVGVHCAQYLLRCLRLVSQSWHAFVDDSVYETKIEKLNCKRQRISRDINSVRASSSKEYNTGSGCDKEGKNSQKLFLSAKVCLYSLKRTVDDLQKKGLFPYNPKPLLRSLAKFEELCEQG